MELLPALVSALANMRKWMAIKDNNVTCRNLSYVWIILLHIVYFV